MRFDPKLGVHCTSDLRFEYDAGVFGPSPELRHLDDVRRSLRDPHCSGPDPLYSIVMDVGREEDRTELEKRMLLVGVVAYAAGRLGEEPVRSQGHIHAIAPHCGWSTPELFEIWEGRAIIYAQERATDNPGRCFAVLANPGDKVVVPPNWAHAVINADPERRMVFGAFCDRQYGFVYDEVRAHGGLAWFPILDEQQNIRWEANPKYRTSEISVRGPRAYPELGMRGVAMYEQFTADPDSLQWVSEPARAEAVWKKFEP
jgi:glucose-6-phosphate isomerase, archaeal